MNLHDKIGQMLIIGFDGKTIDAKSPVAKAIENDNIGGVILFDYNYKQQKFDRNIESPEQVKNLNHSLQTLTHQANLKHQRPDLPLLISVDYEGGSVNRLHERYGFPPTLSAADIGKGSRDQAKSAAEAMAKTLQEAGFNLNFAPLVDLAVNPDNPIIAKRERSFSADPTQVSAYANLYSEVFLQHQIQCAYKHFPGHGSSTQDSHLGFVDVSFSWQPYELDPYRDLFQSNSSCGFIMTAHIVNNQLDDSGLPATLSRKTLTGLLRQELQFKGIIISDDMEMKAISDHYGLEQALTLAINAGVDMLIFGNNLNSRHQDPEEIIQIIEAKVNSGEISVERIDEAYERIMNLKKSLIKPW